MRESFAETTHEKVGDLVRKRQMSPEMIEVKTQQKVSARTVRRILKDPNRNVRRAVAAAIDDLHARHFEVFSTPATAIVENIDFYTEHHSDAQLENDLYMTELAIERLNELNHTNELIRGHLMLALGHIYRARAKYLCEDRKDNENNALEEANRNKARKYYGEGATILGRIDSAAARMLKVKCELNAFGITFDAMDPKKRRSDPGIQEWLRLNSYPDFIRLMLQEQPKNWQLARTGLLFANLLMDDRLCAIHFRLLKQAWSAFENLGHIPSRDLKSIKNDPDFGYFNEHFSDITRRDDGPNGEDQN